MNTLRLPICCCCAIWANWCHAQVTSTFSTSTEGWRVIGDNASRWRVDLGNPSGCYDVDDFATGDHNFAIAPPQFLGNWSSFTPLDTLSVDVFLRNTSGGSRFTAGNNLLRIAGPGGAAHILPVASNYPNPNVWTSYRVTLDPASWVMERGTWTGLLAAVTSLRISAEFVNGDEVVRLDNPRISRSPGPVFVPDLTSTFDVDLDDWSFRNTGGVTFVAGAGNSGGCVRVVAPAPPVAGGATALAPAGYLGNWSALDMVGHLGVDLRIGARVGISAPTLPLLRLVGPNGTAEFRIRDVDLPVGPRTWKRFRAPLRAADWVMVSGTWSALLADVRECQVLADVASGGATVLLDNFQRALDSAGDPDEPVRLHVPDVSRAGWVGMVGASAVARDPSNAMICVLVDDTPANGGGMWQLGGSHLWSLDRPAGLLFDGEGNAFATEDWVSGAVKRRDRSGIESVWVSGFLNSGDDDPYGMAFAPNGFLGGSVSPGDILVTDVGNGTSESIWAFSRHAAQGERLLQGLSSVAAHDITAFSDGRVYAADAANGTRLLQVWANGTTTSLPIAPALGQPVAIAADDVTGALYVMDATDGSLRRINAVSGQSTLVASGFRGFAAGGAVTGTALEIDVRGRRLWLADLAGNRVYEFALPAATLPPIVGAIGQGCGPSPFAVTTIGDSSAWVGQPLGVEIARFGAGTVGFLWLGTSATRAGTTPLPFQLGVFGMTNCAVWTAPDAMFQIPVSGPVSTFTVPIPGSPGFAGLDLYCQAAGLAPGANPAGLVTSRALQVRVGVR